MFVLIAPLWPNMSNARFIVAGRSDAWCRMILMKAMPPHH